MSRLGNVEKDAEIMAVQADRFFEANRRSGLYAYGTAHRGLYG